MAIELKMINPSFKVEHFPSATYYTLCFDGFEGIGNIDEDGDEFFYCCECDTLEDGCWYKREKIKHGFYWNFDKMYDDDHIEADFSEEEREYVMNYMLETINDGRRN